MSFGCPHFRIADYAGETVRRAAQETGTPCPVVQLGWDGRAVQDTNAKNTPIAPAIGWLGAADGGRQRSRAAPHPSAPRARQLPG